VFELGPRDVAAGKTVLKRRDTGTKEVVSQEDARKKLDTTLELMQGELLGRALHRRNQNTVLANSIEEVEEILKPVTAEKGGGKFVMAHLKDDPANDERVKSFKASIRNIPLVDEFDGPGKCILTGEPVEKRAVIAKAY